MKKKLLKQIAKRLLAKKSDDEKASGDKEDVIDEVVDLFEKLGKLDAIKDLRERMKFEESKHGSFDNFEDVTNGIIEHDIAWFKDRDKRNAQPEKEKKKAGKKARKAKAERATAEQEARRRNEVRDRKLREEAEAKARAIKIVKAGDLSLQNLMHADLAALFEDTGSSDLNTILHAKDSSGRYYESVDALCMDHPKFMETLLREHNRNTADTLARVIVILHRCGLHPTLDGYETEYKDQRIALLLDLGEKLNVTRGVAKTARMDAALLLDITCDPDGMCERPLHYSGDPAKVGVAPAWEIKGLRFWAGVVLDIVTHSHLVRSDKKVRSRLERIAEKWDSAPHLCGQDVRRARCRIAAMLKEVSPIGSWYTQDMVTDPVLAALVQVVPDEPMLWQVLGQAERNRLFDIERFANEGSENAFRKTVFDALTEDATSARIDTLLSAIDRLEAFANTHFKRNRFGRIESPYRLEEIIEWGRQLSRKPPPLAANDPKAAVMDVDLDLMVAPALLVKPLLDVQVQSDIDVPPVCRMGGLPQLPDDLAWPMLPDGRAYHFYAQFDLASLPRRVGRPPKIFDLPTFPDEGTLFIFVPLAGENHFEYSPTLLFTKGPVAHLPGRAPPAKTPVLDGEAAKYLLPEGIREDKVTLRCQNLEVVPFMSARRATIYQTAHTSETPMELTQSLIDTLLESSLTQAANRNSRTKGKVAKTAWNTYVKSSMTFEADKLKDQLFQGSARHPPQLFGYGDDVQGTLSFEQAQKGKIMLFQVGNKFGTPLNLVDLSIQAWITPDDLAAGCFERVEWTQESS